MDFRGGSVHGRLMRAQYLLHLPCTLAVLWVSFAANLCAEGADWPFFPFQNAATDDSHPTPAAQAKLAKALGYDGVGSVYPQDVAAFAAACDREGLRLFNAYVVLPIDGTPALTDDLKAQLAPLQGRQALLWLGLTSKTHRPAAATGEPEALAVIAAVADHADSLGAAVALYPHAGFWVERTDHAVQLAKRLARPNVGVSFNLCHFLKVDVEERLESVIQEAAPWLRVVSLNGAESGRAGGSWQELIQPLNRGSFDNLRLLRALRANGFSGPIGFQGYGIGGSAEQNLRGTMKAWRELNLWLATESETGAARLRFVPEGDGGFSFDTGLLRGRLRADGRSRGLSRVEHVPTGSRLDGSYGWLSHYRVFTRGVRYGNGAWDWPSTATLQPNGSVIVNWPAAGGRPFELRAQYQWSSAGTLEVRTTVQATQGLQGFETFLASYFNAAFTNAHARVREANNTSPTWMRLDPQLGLWLMFPRDEAARQLLQDGRWTLEPHPVDWVLPAEFAPPQATLVRHAPATGVTVALTASDDGCFAAASPHELEGHYSCYFSLFGQDLRAGESASATVRLSLARGWDPLAPSAPGLGLVTSVSVE
jgi:sugar phosphate isomerase/epimerase